MSSQAHGGLQWNAGGWFGAQLGSTCWMLIAAGMVMPRDATAGLIALTVCLGANAVATAMWMWRESLDAYRAMQLLVVVSGIASFTVTRVLDRAGQFASLGVGGRVSANAMYLLLALMIPGLLLLFHLVQRESGGVSSGPNGSVEAQSD